MPSVVVPQAAFLRLIWGVSGVAYAVNVIGVRNASAVAITQALTNTIGAAVKTSFATSGLNAQLATIVTLMNVGLRDIATANKPEFLDAGAAVAGTMAGDMLPPQTALCVTLRTALAGRSFRGRVYLPGWAEGANAATGVASAAASTAAAAFMVGVGTALATSGLDGGVVSRPAPLAVPPRAGFVTSVSAYVVRDLVWDTQRRRAHPGI
jgi:hypothetical protein